jgi:hypothetical protein
MGTDAKADGRLPQMPEYVPPRGTGHDKREQRHAHEHDAACRGLAEERSKGPMILPKSGSSGYWFMQVLDITFPAPFQDRGDLPT